MRIAELIPGGVRWIPGETALPAEALNRRFLEEISAIDDKIFEANKWGIESFGDSIKNDYDFLIAAVGEAPAEGLPEQAEAAASSDRETFGGAASSDRETLGDAASSEQDGTRLRAVGFGLLRCFDDAELIRIAVSPEERRRGTGRLLLRELIAECRRREIPNLFLEVRSGNEAAIGLYSQAGFTAEGIRRNYYHEPLEDALIMRYTC